MADQALGPFGRALNWLMISFLLRQLLGRLSYCPNLTRLAFRDV